MYVKININQSIAKLRSCFSHAPTMNKTREELRNMWQLEHESVSVYMYRWGRALYRSSGIQPENERHPQVIKDFISSLEKNIRSKITNRWAEMRQPPNTVQKDFKLVSNVEKQLQVTDSFILDFPSYPTGEVNELSAEESSGDEGEINEISRGKRSGNNNGNYKRKHSNFSGNHTFGNKSQYTKPQDNKQGKQWEHKSKDSKITLTQESAHHIPTKFSSSFFWQFNLAMKLEKGRAEETG